ncbi:MAG: pentapeptide repeat-containing protein, partial [Deltaproteobacteria bacterium]|nr:pentapeptide repeat-containing protein [Deltaproteobacteria bacterium]
ADLRLTDFTGANLGGINLHRALAESAIFDSTTPADVRLTDHERAAAEDWKPSANPL